MVSSKYQTTQNLLTLLNNAWHKTAQLIHMQYGRSLLSIHK